MPRPATNQLLFCVLATVLSGCMSEHEYRAKNEHVARNAIARIENQHKQPQLSKRGKKLAMAGNSLGKVGLGERGSAKLTKAEAPFVRMSGYVVRGTDESSFVSCGSPVVSYTRVSAEAVGQLVQRYRFKAPKPLSAVYFNVEARVLSDTVEIGANRYTSVVEIKRVYPEVVGERPVCAPPPWGSLIERREVSLRR